MQTTELRKDYIEYKLVFLLSLLNIGHGSFSTEPLSENKTKLTAYVKIGYDGALERLIDKIVLLIVPKQVAEKHIREEGENMKRYLEK